MNFYVRGKEVVEKEINALCFLKNSMEENFNQLIEMLLKVKGKIIIMGVGKSGNIGQKISATMCSLGLPSYYLDPMDALHGSLGMLEKEDIVIMISNSGNTEELLKVIPSIKILGCKSIAITQNADSELAHNSDISYILPPMAEVDLFNLAPTTSTTTTLALGDALAVVLSESKQFKKEQFGLYHPGGTLGKKVMTRVKDVMHKEEDLPIVGRRETLSNVINIIGEKKIGIAIVVENNHLLGVITSGDIRRCLEKRLDIYSLFAEDIMNGNPIVIDKEKLAVEAISILENLGKNVSVLPVVDEDYIIEGALVLNDIFKLGILLNSAGEEGIKTRVIEESIKKERNNHIHNKKLFKNNIFSQIKMFLTDSDGCLTDGGMYYSEKGDELKKFNTKDGMGFKLLKERGIITGIITGENRELVQWRSDKLGIDICKIGVEDKLSCIQDLCKLYNVELQDILYIGDDINDLEVIKSVGFGCCVSDAHSSLRSIAKYVTVSKGGEGAIREIVDLILNN